MKKRVSVIVLLLISGLYLAGCGSSSEGTASNKDDEIINVQTQNQNEKSEDVKRPEDDIRKIYEDILEKDYIEIDTAYKTLAEYDNPDDEIRLFIEELSDLIECEGVFVYESERTGNRYTANVAFYLQHGETLCSVEYTGYMGTISDGLVKPLNDEEYLYEAEPKGDLYGHEQDFLIQFSPASLHIKWADTEDFILSRGDGSVEYAQDNKSQSSFEESDVYASIVELIDNTYESFDHSVRYDTEDKALYIYIEAPEDTRSTLKKGKNNEDVVRTWSAIVDNTTSLGSKLYTVLHAGKDGDHVYICWVDRLDSQDVYSEDDYLLFTDNDTVRFNIMDEDENSTDKPQGENESKTESNPGGTSYPAHTMTTGEANALDRAKQYLAYSAFSYSGLVEQLEFEGYSHSESTYAADHCGADWNAQAVKKAKEYLNFSSFSRYELIDQLVFEGFTQAQAEYGVSQAY